MITHAKCGSEWSGLTTMHCAGCHLNFLGLGAFDYHRRGGVCVPPQSLEVTVHGVPTPAPLVLSSEVWVPEHPRTGKPGHYKARGYEAWSFPEAS